MDFVHWLYEKKKTNFVRETKEKQRIKMMGRTREKMNERVRQKEEVLERETQEESRDKGYSNLFYGH